MTIIAHIWLIDRLNFQLIQGFRFLQKKSFYTPYNSAGQTFMLLSPLNLYPRH